MLKHPQPAPVQPNTKFVAGFMAAIGIRGMNKLTTASTKHMMANSQNAHGQFPRTANKLEKIAPMTNPSGADAPNRQSTIFFLIPG
ncbi:hypothetical protein QC761_0079620 [Podospora bellae-mahoneyi]|uniref:Uncharacterized protein n=1 Tax=Podospora bellae-mahoneyi TaxID=2093777 RepID=A0ABR0FFV3_9PEZI|nr:hypothetical protein QC761_0079620 [Podospora bellae-mahoneyi]